MNPERAMDSARSVARGHWRMRKARHTAKGKPERNGRRSREIGAQAVRSKLGRWNFDLGRARWMRGGCDRMNGQTKDLSDRNACFIYDTDERGSGIGGECSLIFAYVRLCSHIGKKMLRALRAATGGVQEGRMRNAEPSKCGVRVEECRKDQLGTQELKKGFLNMTDSSFPDFLICPPRIHCADRGLRIAALKDYRWAESIHRRVRKTAVGFRRGDADGCDRDGRAPLCFATDSGSPRPCRKQLLWAKLCFSCWLERSLCCRPY